MSARSLTMTGTDTLLMIDRVISTSSRGVAPLSLTWTLVAPPRTAAATRSASVARRSSASSVMATRRRIFGSSISRYLLVVVVLLEARFFVPDAWLVDFFGVESPDLTLDLEVDLLAAFTGVLLVAREEILVGRLASPRPDVEAIASIRGTGFLAGIVARICLMAVVC